MRANTFRAAFDAGWGPGSLARLDELKAAFGMTHAEAIGIEAGEEYFLHPDRPDAEQGRSADGFVGSLVAATHRREASTGLSAVVGTHRSPPGIRASGGDIAFRVRALLFQEQGCL